MMFAAGSSMAQAGLQGGHLDDAMNAGTIGLISSGIGQGVAQGIGAGVGNGFFGTLAQGAGAGFASGGAVAIMSGQSGANAWEAAYQGASMGAATAGVIWGIQQGMNAYQSSQRAHELAKMYTEAAANSLDISQFPMYASASQSSIIMDGGGDYWRVPSVNNEALQSSWIGDLMIDTASMGFAGALKATPGALFGKGGLVNSNEYLRIGVGRKGGERVFRIAGKWLERFTGKAHIDLWKGGSL